MPAPVPRGKDTFTHRVERGTLTGTSIESCQGTRMEPQGYAGMAIGIVIVFAVLAQFMNPIIAGILSVAAFTGGVAITGTLSDLLG